MGRGLSQRRRLKNFEAAKQAKTGKFPLPPPPEELERKQKKRRKLDSGSYDGPSSFRKMMQLKEAVEKRQGRETRAAEPLSSRQRKNKFLRNTESQNLAASPAPAPAQAEESDRSKLAAPAVRAKQPNLDSKAKQPPIFHQKPLKARKKEFLNQKKKRKKKKGKQSLTVRSEDATDDSAEDIEDRVMADIHRPAFGEQAMQPLQINLKRKHWVKSAGRGNNPRLPAEQPLLPYGAEERESCPAAELQVS